MNINGIKIFSFEDDVLGLGKAFGSIGDNFEKISNTMANRVDDMVNAPFKILDKIQEHTDKTRAKRIEEIKRANVPLNENDLKKIEEEQENMKERVGNDPSKLSGEDLFRFEQYHNFKQTDIKSELKNSIDSIKDVEKCIK